MDIFWTFQAILTFKKRHIPNQKMRKLLTFFTILSD